jgi:hypothetical protein
VQNSSNSRKEELANIAKIKAEKKANDTYQEHVLSKVTESESGWEINFDGSSCFFIPKKHGVQPRKGDKMRMYGKGFGYVIRGVDLNGVEVYYKTDAEHRAETRRELAESDAKRKAAADADREAMDERVAALPDCFQKRIARFRRNNPDFYWKNEGYEMAACVDAVKIADTLRKQDDPLAALNAFYDLPFAEQAEMVEGLDEGHSGNTFGMACKLAGHYLNNERLVFAEHAAISKLIGCKEAGCPVVTDEEMREAGYEPFEKVKE